MKRTIAAIILFALTLSVCGCEPVTDKNAELIGAYTGQEQETAEAVKKTAVTMLYYPDMDVDPVTTNVYANSELLKLVYCPLYRAGSELRCYPVLAASAETDGLTVTVKLRSGIKFSNGEPVTPSDVIKSYNAAAASVSSPYRAQLSAFKSWKERDGGIAFTLNAPVADPLMLLDVPVMQGGKAGVGCGPYVLGDRGGKPVLTPNGEFFTRPQIELIRLTDTADDGDITGLFAAGELDVISSLQAGELSLTAKRDYTMYDFPTNKLLYIGINHRGGRFGDPALRQAMSACIDRQALSSRTLAGLGDPAEYPFNPVWREYSAQPREIIPFEGEYTLVIPEGSDLKRAAANAVADGFRAAGAQLNVTELPAEQMESAVASDKYDLYLGETAISRTMDPTFLYAAGGSLNLTGFSSPGLDESWRSFLDGTLDFEGYLAAFSAETPVIPLLFRRDVLFCDKRIEGITAQSPWNILGDFTAVRLK